MRFEIGQQYRGKLNPNLIATVLETSEEGHVAKIQVRVADGEYADTVETNFAQFILNWTLVTPA